MQYASSTRLYMKSVHLHVKKLEQRKSESEAAIQQVAE